MSKGRPRKAALLCSGLLSQPEWPKCPQAQKYRPESPPGVHGIILSGNKPQPPQNGQVDKILILPYEKKKIYLLSLSFHNKSNTKNMNIVGRRCWHRLLGYVEIIDSYLLSVFPGISGTLLSPYVCYLIFFFFLFKDLWWFHMVFCSGGNLPFLSHWVHWQGLAQGTVSLGILRLTKPELEECLID